MDGPQCGSSAQIQDMGLLCDLLLCLMHLNGLISMHLPGEWRNLCLRPG
jgi:hypothetical protein